VNKIFLTFFLIFLFLSGCLEQVTPLNAETSDSAEQIFDENNESDANESGINGRIEPAENVLIEDVVEIVVEDTGSLSCDFDTENITLSFIPFGKILHRFWLIPVTITNNSEKTAETVIATIIPKGDETKSTSQELEKINPKSSISTSLKYNVRVVDWINPKISLSSDVNADSSCNKEINYEPYN